MNESTELFWNAWINSHDAAPDLAELRALARAAIADATTPPIEVDDIVAALARLETELGAAAA